MRDDGPLQPVSVTPPASIGTVLVRQSWRDLTFLHWRVPPEAVAPLLPAGTRPDVHDGTSWVGLVPFRLARTAARRGPAVPWLGTFPETNVRLYSVDAQGRRGVVFRTLETARLALVPAARATLALPYAWSRMRVVEDDGVVAYSSRRRWPGPRTARTAVVVRPGAPLPAPGALEVFLTARWGLHTRTSGRTLWLPVRHRPWPLREAEVLALEDSLVDVAGLPGVSARPPASVLFSRGVDAQLGAAVPAHLPG